MSAIATAAPMAAQALHRDALVVDMTMPWGDYAQRAELKPGTLDRLRASGYTLVALTAAQDRTGFAEAMASLAKERRFFLERPDAFVLVDTVDDVLRAKREGKLAVIFQFQGSNPLEGRVENVALFYDLGVRLMLLAYNMRNYAADGCHERTDAGLSRYGIALVEEMNRVGMLVDVTHVGYRSSMDAIEASSAPVIFSHSNPRAIHDHERNIKDDQIRACAATGGVVGINGLDLFLGGEPTVELFLKHLRYCVDLVGPDHVGLGLDFVYDPETLTNVLIRGTAARFPASSGYDRAKVPRFFQPEQVPEVTEALLAGGLAEGDVRKILGENWLRVARQVWRPADKGRTQG
ncbi:MAG: dipeptidase [Alphaproteobacteria bacterium]|nr:dipeptidase [Alphaproteobacteria bacterium]